MRMKQTHMYSLGLGGGSRNTDIKHAGVSVMTNYAECQEQEEYGDSNKHFESRNLHLESRKIVRHNIWIGT